MIQLDFTQEPLKSIFQKAFAEQCRAFFLEEPQADPQFTCDEVAELLAVDVATVRTYLKLPAYHQRHLPKVQCTDSSRGYRIRLSEVRAWQQRNSLTPAEDKVREPDSLLRISHRRIAQRNRKAA